MSVALSVNLNKIALVRNSRGGTEPDPRDFARIALAAGADGITVHPRPDGRHIRAADVVALSEICKQTGTELNVEGNPFSEARDTCAGFMDLVARVRPQQCTLVPDEPNQLTSDHGFRPGGDVAARLKPVVAKLCSWGCRVSIFSDPEEQMVDFAIGVGAQRIELYTGPYAHADDANTAQMLERYVQVARLARDKGLELNAGHDLNLHNLTPFTNAVVGLREVSIGHALVTDALHMGMEQAVRAYIKCLG